MDRRAFLRAVTAASTAALGPLQGRAEPTRSPSSEKGGILPLPPGPQERVFLSGVSRGASKEAIRKAVREAAEAATDFSWLSRGDAVFIKPASNSSNPYPATTSPAAVAAVIELLQEKGAGRVIVGDMSGVQFVRFSPNSLSGSSRKLMVASGLAAAAQEAGAELHFFEEAGWDGFYEERPLHGTHWKSPLTMPNVLRQVQHIVVLPRCARHVLAGSTLGLKAVVGYWRHDTRLEYHRDAATLQEKTAEANTVPTLREKQRLVLTVADKLLTTFGPDHGSVHSPETGLVVASESVLAHDMVSLAWLLENRRHSGGSGWTGVVDSSDAFARIANHVVTGWLGGARAALSSETLVKGELANVWDDRVITRACEILGGVPRVTLTSANGAVPEDLKRRLGEMISLARP